MKQGKNYFYTKHSYINYSKTKDNFGLFIFPAIMFDRNLPIGVGLEVTRITFLFLKNRYFFEFGKIKYKHEFSLEHPSISRMIDWIRNQGKELSRFNRNDLERVIQQNPNLKDLLTDNAADMFYNRQMVLEFYLDTIQKEKSGDLFDDFQNP